MLKVNFKLICLHYKKVLNFQLGAFKPGRWKAAAFLKLKYLLNYMNDFFKER